MRRNICMKIGIIGNGKHSKRLQKILNKKKLNFFVYKPKKPNYFDENEFLKFDQQTAIESLSQLIILEFGKTLFINHFSHL